MKNRLFVPLFVVAFLTMANSAFAELACNVSSTPVARATASGHTEQAGDINFSCTAPGATATTAATITISYGGVKITNDTTYPLLSVPPRPIAITGASGSFTGGGLPTVTNATISNAAGVIVINVPAQAVPAAGSFSLTGVLVSLEGTNFTTLDAQISVSPGNGLTIGAGQNTTRVITSIQAGLASAGLLTGTQSALYFGTSTVTGLTAVPTRGSFTAVITENYLDMFREQAQFAGALNDTQLLVTFAGIPTGASLTGCTATMNNATTGVATAAVTLSSATVTPVTTGGLPGPTLTVTINGGALADQSQIEQVRITCTGVSITLGTTPQPLTAPITATVTLGPTGAALSSTNTVLTAATTGQIPRYQQKTLDIGTVVAFTPNTTTMIIPFAVGDPSTTATAGTFDTGIVIANTTGETVGGNGIFSSGGAQAQAGTITLYFFPNSGTAADRFSVTTASIASGASFVSNVSELLRTAGRTTSFSGYVIAVANFTNAHGMAFVYGGRDAGSRITSATDVMTIAPPVISGRSAFGALVGNGVESTSK